MTLDETKNILINKAKNSQIPKGEKRKYSSLGSFAQKNLKRGLSFSFTDQETGITYKLICFGYG
jgi:hypothetical protein